MGTIRDPSFWRRFSLAAHRAEEKSQRKNRPSPSPEDQHLQASTGPPSGSVSPLGDSPPPSYLASAELNSNREISNSNRTDDVHQSLTDELRASGNSSGSGSNRNTNKLMKMWKYNIANSHEDTVPDSWLEAQQRKSRLKARICWAFWLVFAVIVVGVVFIGVYVTKSTKPTS